MQFAIQVGNPTILRPQTTLLPDLAYAIEELFPTDTEDAILYWNSIPVLIGYKYHLSMLIDELLPLLSAVLCASKGSYQASWDDSSFDGYWYLEWDEHQMTIEAEWFAVAGNYQALLNSRDKLRISKDAFLREWKGLLRKLIEALYVTGVQIEAQEELETLCRIEAAIPAFGKLDQLLPDSIILSAMLLHKLEQHDVPAMLLHQNGAPAQDGASAQDGTPMHAVQSLAVSPLRKPSPCKVKRIILLS
jgi:hypothetical protein